MALTFKEIRDRMKSKERAELDRETFEYSRTIGVRGARSRLRIAEDRMAKAIVHEMAVAKHQNRKPLDFDMDVVVHHETGITLGDLALDFAGDLMFTTLPKRVG